MRDELVHYTNPKTVPDQKIAYDRGSFYVNPMHKTKAACGLHDDDDDEETGDAINLVFTTNRKYVTCPACREA